MVEFETVPNEDGVELSDADMAKLEALNGAVPFVAKFLLDGEMPVFVVMNGINMIYEGKPIVNASGSFRIAPTSMIEAGLFINFDNRIAYAYQKSGL